MIRLYQFEISPFCDKIRRVLHVKRQRYEIVEVPISRSLSSVRRVNPIGKLPTLEHDGRIVADSSDIARYLEEVFPEPSLLPSDSRERALVHVLEDWADESLYFYEMTLRFTLPHNARRSVPALLAHDPAWLARALGPWIPRLMRRTVRGQGVGRKPGEQLLCDVERHVGAVSGLLGEGRWLVGDRLSLADISVHAQLRCIGETDEGGKLIEARPRVRAWLDRVEAATAPSV
ncbi:MAG: glutathione S-transferase family protein [Myxococcota bacterium]